jgi:hypothetical protein
MIGVSTVMRLTTECGHDTTKLKHLESVCVWLDVFVWTLFLFCFCALSFLSISLLWMSRFIPVYLVQQHKLLQISVQLHPPLYRH